MNEINKNLPKGQFYNNPEELLVRKNSNENLKKVQIDPIKDLKLNQNYNNLNNINPLEEKKNQVLNRPVSSRYLHQNINEPASNYVPNNVLKQMPQPIINNYQVNNKSPYVIPSNNVNKNIVK